MQRGFKARAEKLSEEIRRDMARGSRDAVDAMDLARHVGAEVRRADELASLAKLEALESLQPGAFSACTFTIGTRQIIVYSPLASPGRTQSDIAHEVAHLMLKHSVKGVQSIGGISFFTCDSEEEEEANWLGACLLLPRQLLYNAAKRGLGPSEIAVTYNVSEAMASFRLRTTGVMRQLSPQMARDRARDG